MRVRALGLPVIALALGACSGTGVVATTVPSTIATTTTLPPSTTTAAPTTTTTTTVPVDVSALARAVLMVGLPGKTLDEATAAHLGAGGRAIVLFDRNIGSAGQLRLLTAAAACAAGEPILVAVDQELGPVARLAGLVTPLPTTTEAMAMAPMEMELTGQLLGRQMLALGVNVDLAPIVDVVAGPNPLLEGRHLGGDPALVADLGAAFVRGLQKERVMAVPKHFPGHGRSATDPHYETARIDASLEDLEAVDLPPFTAAFAAGAHAVMIGHPVYDALDPDLPASLSPAVLDLLRRAFGFDGVAVTDSLSMQGVAGGRPPAQLAVAALTAGEDLLLVEDPAQVEPMVGAIVAAVATGDLALERLQEAAERVLRLAAIAGPVRCRSAP